MTSSSMTAALGRKLKRANARIKLYEALIEEAAPLVAITAFKGGSLYYKDWVDKARALGIYVANPTNPPLPDDGA